MNPLVDAGKKFFRSLRTGGLSLLDTCVPTHNGCPNCELYGDHHEKSESEDWRMIQTIHLHHLELKIENFFFLQEFLSRICRSLKQIKLN